MFRDGGEKEKRGEQMEHMMDMIKILLFLLSLWGVLFTVYRGNQSYPFLGRAFRPAGAGGRSGVSGRTGGKLCVSILRDKGYDQIPGMESVWSMFCHWYHSVYHPYSKSAAASLR